MANLYKLFLSFTLLVAVIAIDRSSMQECQSSCQGDDTVVPCQRGCRFHHIEELLVGSAEVAFDKCNDDCEEAYGLLANEVPQCQAGCEKRQKLSDHAANDEQNITEAGWMGPVIQMREMFTRRIGDLHILTTRVVAMFVRGDEVMVLRSPQSVMIMEAPEVKATEIVQAIEAERIVEADEEAKELFRDNVGEMNRRRKQTALAINVCAVLVTAVVFLLALYFWLKTSLRRNALAHHKQANLTVAVKQQPLKLVRPEDLTKLSLIDDEQPTATLDLPSAQV